MDPRILHDSDSHSELEQNCPPPDVPSLSLSLRPRKTPEPGHEDDSCPLRRFFFFFSPFSQLRWIYYRKDFRGDWIFKLSLAFRIGGSYQPWHCNLPSRQRSPRTPNFIKVASDLDIARPSKADTNGIDEDSLGGLFKDAPSANGIEDNFYASLSHEIPANTGEAGLIHDGFFSARRQTMDSSYV